MLQRIDSRLDTRQGVAGLRSSPAGRRQHRAVGPVGRIAWKRERVGRRKKKQRFTREPNRPCRRTDEHHHVASVWTLAAEQGQQIDARRVSWAASVHEVRHRSALIVGRDRSNSSVTRDERLLVRDHRHLAVRAARGFA